MSVYVLRVTVICPEEMIDAANQLALLLGESSGDAQTFRTAAWVAADGERYAVASLAATAGFPDAAAADLAALPNPHGADVAAAQPAQAMLEVWLPAGGTPPPAPAPDRLAAYIFAAPMALLAAFDLAVARGAHINRDAAARLQILPGVGPALAQDIIDGRPWASPDDLSQISGISSAEIEAWRADPGLAA